jgi:hypothetical protein
MMNKKRLLARILITVSLVSLAPAVALGGDESFSSVIKHLKKNYHAKQQGFLGAMMIARFAVKVIKPAGVKNFKMVYLKDLDYSHAESPERGHFHAFIRDAIDPKWAPLVEYSSPRERQWSYVYVTRENEDVKLLVVTLQQQNAVVMQTKFSPAKLVEFMNNPQIMGISLNSDNKPKDTSARTDDLDGADADASQKQKPAAEKPPNEIK